MAPKVIKTQNDQEKLPGKWLKQMSGIWWNREDTIKTAFGGEEGKESSTFLHTAYWGCNSPWKYKYLEGHLGT